MTDYYSAKLQAGLEYQDFISDELRMRGIYLGAYSSQKYQYEKGESASGIEIKYDMRVAETGNLYIEVAEKSNENVIGWTSSGIFRKDNTKFYLIGDRLQAFLFSKHQLQDVYHDTKNYDRRGIKLKETKTSKGFIYPVHSALKGMCLVHFVFDNNNERR